MSFFSPPILKTNGEGGLFSEESPSGVSEVTSVTEDDDVELAVEHGRDGERLPLAGLE